MTAILALDLGTTTGWALRSADGSVTSGAQSFKPGRFEAGDLRHLRFRAWPAELVSASVSAVGSTFGAVSFEELRRHPGVDAAHAYGGFLATLPAWCEHHQIPYRCVAVGTIKRHATGKGNADKVAMLAAMTALGHKPVDDKRSRCACSVALGAESARSRAHRMSTACELRFPKFSQGFHQRCHLGCSQGCSGIAPLCWEMFGSDVDKS